MATFTGTSGNDSLLGSSGNDRILPGNGNDTVDGGGGTDTLVMPGPRANYSITQTFAGYTVVDTAGSTGTKTASNVAALEFTDTVANLAIAADARTITSTQLNSLVELYTAYFNRVPEAGGLDYWISQFKAGMSLNDIGNNFYLAAVDYSSYTGYSSTMTDTEFITKIYQNVLGRSSPDSNGLSYWLNGLAPGGGETRGSLVNTIIGAAHGYKTDPDPTLSRVADLLDNKLSVGIYHAVTAGIDYLTPADAITNAMAIVARVTATDTSDAITLIGLPDFQSPPMPA